MGSDNIFPWKQTKGYVFALVGIGLLVYFYGLFGAFVWDDISQIVNNYTVHSAANILIFFLGSTFAPQNSNVLGGLYYRPVMDIMFSILYSLFGTQTFYYHFLQLTFHIANSVLLFFIFKKFFNKTIAFFISLVFLAHPINVEAVVYVAALQEPLFSFFGLLALFLFISETFSLKRYLVIGSLLLLSILSKETGFLFGIIILAYYILFKNKSFKQSVSVISVLVVPIIMYAILRFPIAKIYFEKLPDVPMMTATLSQRIYTMPAIFLFYIKTFFFPKDLFIFQEWLVPTANGAFYLPLIIDTLVLVTLALIGLWIYRSQRKYLTTYVFFCIWFLVGVGFHLQIFPLDFTVADRLFYFPIIGLLGVIGIVVQNIKVTNHNFRVAGIYITLVIVIILSIRTIVRSTNWVNGVSLYSHDLQYQQNDRLENLLATDLNNEGQYAEAQKHFAALLSRNPKQSALIFNLGMTYEHLGNMKKAEETFQNGLPYDDVGVLYANDTKILYDSGEVTQAKAVISQGILKFPQNYSLRLIDAIIMYKLGDKQEALNETQKAKTLSTDPRIDQIYQGILNNTINF